MFRRCYGIICALLFASATSVALASGDNHGPQQPVYVKRIIVLQSRLAPRVLAPSLHSGRSDTLTNQQYPVAVGTVEDGRKLKRYVASISPAQSDTSAESPARSRTDLRSYRLQF